MVDIWDNVVRDITAEIGGAVYLSSTRSSRCESPIEQAFQVTFTLLCRVGSIEVYGARDIQPAPSFAAFVEPQVAVGDYRVDFVVGLMHKQTTDLKHCIAVECDGHEWHERTKEQAARDKARDRFLQGQFGRVLHFTGSEIYRSPGKCASEALAAATEVYQDFLSVSGGA